MDDEDSLVQRRSRRSTAGNRMEAALAEISVEDPQEGDEDRDFVTDPDEGDIFESDFESTDDEAAQPAAEAPDRAVAEDERRERKAIKSRLERATAAAAARQRVTFNPEAEESISTPRSEREKKRRRVSLGTAVDAETGELVGDRRRQSGRALTALARTASLARRVEEEKQKSSAPKKTKVKEKPPTQDELLQRALDMEDGNIAAHRDYLAIEEEKRRRAHVVRVAVEGPLVRWISQREVRELSPSSDITTAAVIPSPSPAAPVASVSTSADALDQSIANRLATMSTPTASSPDLPAVVPFQPGQQTSLYTTLFPPKSIPKPLPSTKSPLPPPSSPPRPREPAPPTTEMVAQQYLVHESSQDLDARTPPWKDTMAALFGDHVAWSELRVYAAKNRPLARPVRACPITGLPARYRDPRTGVPFATPEAYAVLTKILNHEYVWSPVLGCYVTPYEVSGESGTSATGSKDKITRESSRRGRRGEVHSETAP